MKTKKYWAETQHKPCRICGIAIGQHTCCSGCGALIGPQHIEIEPYWLKDKTYCKVCFEARGGILADPRIE